MGSGPSAKLRLLLHRQGRHQHTDLGLRIVLNLLERTLSGAEGRMGPRVEARGWAKLPSLGSRLPV